MWGTPSLYSLVRKEATKSKNKLEIEPRVSDTDVFVDAPKKKGLFEDCRWGKFMRYSRTLIYGTFFTRIRKQSLHTLVSQTAIM